MSLVRFKDIFLAQARPVANMLTAARTEVTLNTPQKVCFTGILTT